MHVHTQDVIKVTFRLVGTPVVQLVQLLCLLGSQQQRQDLYDKISIAVSAQDILSGNVIEQLHFATPSASLISSGFKKAKHVYNVFKSVS
jgi:hypothetical protein